MRRKIAVYDGVGVSLALRPPFLAFDPWFIGPDDLLKGALEQVDVFIMPGGRDLPYHAALQGKGNRLIRSFVEKGGRYVGLCAGAYYGCKRVIFDPGLPLEVCGIRELCFFGGSAIGPAYGFGSFEYETQKGACAALIETESDSFYSYYHGGCFFEGDFSACTILGRYGDLPDKPPAIISCPIGLGKAVLSGVHLETTPELIEAIDTKQTFSKTDLNLLRESQNKRNQFISKFVIN